MYCRYYCIICSIAYINMHDYNMCLFELKLEKYKCLKYTVLSINTSEIILNYM